MKAIIIAAGTGKRIGENIKQTPKSLIQVNGKSIIEYQIDALKKMNVEEIIVITGPYSEKFHLENVQYIKDVNHEEHEILGSLMVAREFLKDEVLVLYSDIIFTSEILENIVNSTNDIALAVDMNWRERYIGRTEHPLSEAENVLLDDKKHIKKIKKNISDDESVVGEFLGIIKFTLEGSKKFVKIYDEVIKTHKGKFHDADTVSKAYVTDMIQELIDSKIQITPISVKGKWCEIDTMQDLKRAEELF